MTTTAATATSRNNRLIRKRGSYRVRLADTSRDLIAAKRLRFEVSNVALREELAAARRVRD